MSEHTHVLPLCASSSVDELADAGGQGGGPGSLSMRPAVSDALRNTYICRLDELVQGITQSFAVHSAVLVTFLCHLDISLSVTLCGFELIPSWPSWTPSDTGKQLEALDSFGSFERKSREGSDDCSFVKEIRSRVQWVACQIQSLGDLDLCCWSLERLG